jgi:glutathione S-transferase
MDQLTLYQQGSLITAAAFAISIPLWLTWRSKTSKAIIPTNGDKIILCGVPKKSDNPSPSAYCQKVESFLRATSTPYENRFAKPQTSPKGKLPYIILRDKVISDSHFIVQYLVENNISPNLDISLTRSQLADSRSWQTYIEGFIFPCIIYERWFSNENFKIHSQELFSHLPWLLRIILCWYFRRLMWNTLWSQGIGRHSDDERLSILKRAIDDLDTRFGNEELTFHRTKEPTLIDIITFGFFLSALATDANPTFNNLLLERPKLVEFTKRMTLQYFPEYKRVLSILDGAKVQR